MKNIKNTTIIAEIGINHNGSIELCKKLIDSAVIAGCDYVKFQKRNPEVCVPDHQKNIIRSTPWGEIPYIEYKHKLEFSEDQYDEINEYCKSKDIKWFASVWDLDSVDFMCKYSDIAKIPSALITNIPLLERARQKFNKLIISTGMSTESEIEIAIDVCNPEVIMHTNSTYPCPVDEINLEYITWLSNKYPDREIGYSGHEYGLIPTFASIPLGASWIERHITIDREFWGSDQSASVEPVGLIKLVKGIRAIEKSLGGNLPRVVLPGELAKRKSLRGI